MIEGFVVRYKRNGVEDRFFSFDRTRAEEYAVKYNGVISRMIEECPVQSSQPLCMIKGEDSLQQDKTATPKPTR